jgi:hypothetical protein
VVSAADPLAFEIQVIKIPWLLVRKRTTPTDRSPLVSEVSVKLFGNIGVAWLAQRVSTAVNLFYSPDRCRNTLER